MAQELPPFFIYGAVAAIPVYYFSYWIFEKVLIPRFFTLSFNQRLKNLEDKKLVLFMTIFPSTVHAFFHVFGVPPWITFGYSTAHNAAKIAYYDDHWPAFFQGVFAGYMVADYSKCGFKTLGIAFTVHHVFAMAAWTLSAYLRSMQWQTALLQFCELSTIFMNLRQLLLTAGYASDGAAVTVVSLIFMISFFAVRVVPLPMILRELFLTGFVDMRDKDGLFFALCGAGFTMLHAALQLMWFSIMMKKLFSVVLGNDKKKEKDGKKQK